MELLRDDELEVYSLLDQTASDVLDPDVGMGDHPSGLFVRLPVVERSCDRRRLSRARGTCFGSGKDSESDDGSYGIHTMCDDETLSF